MRVHLALSVIAMVGAGCTAFVAANLSNTNGTVQHTVGGCFNLADTTCGECIANNCEDPNNATQPVSLQKVCSWDYSSVKSAAQDCSQNSSINNYNCAEMFIDGGTYATSIDTQQAAENNLRHCITDHCLTSCSRCAVQVPTCGSTTVDLLEAGTCGTCIDQAMNAPGSPCQKYVISQDSVCTEYSSGSVATCAIPSGSCQTADCSDLSSPPANITDAGYAFYSCLWSQCGSQCPSP